MKRWRFLVVLALSSTPALAAGCRSSDPLLAGTFKEEFERADLGSDWRDTGGHYRIVDGTLAAKGARNHPLWLRKRLPHDVAIEFDANPTGEDGDIRVTLFGDGKSTNASDGGCGSTGYTLIFGAMKNKLDVLCREQQPAGGHSTARSDWQVVPGRTYHYYITRKGDIVDWYVDGLAMLAFRDPQPLAGPGHEYFAFDGWESEVFFDNLTIGPPGP
jgi:hypothetical protein